MGYDRLGRSGGIDNVPGDKACSCRDVEGSGCTLDLTLTAIGGYAAKAQALGFCPFEESAWRKAKRTYGDNDENT